MKRAISLLVICWVSLVAAYRPEGAELSWVDQQLAQMTVDQKIGQLIMVRASTKGKKGERASILNQIRKYHIGGICFFQGDPRRQVDYINEFQAASKIPLLVSIDGEWGLGMRYSEHTMSFPRQLTLGAIQDNSLIYEMGKEVARQMRRTGIHINFAPVVDVNNNPRNPVINDRSFGEDKYNVAAKSYAYMKGMQDGGLIACAKHFPGHGDTDVDSHYGLPTISHTRKRLFDIEMMPFRSLVDEGVASIMVAHLHLPALDDRDHRPATLSRPIVTDILRGQMGFDGLIFTDAMEMKGVADHFPNGVSDAEAILAGNDVVLLPNDIAKTVATIKSYIASGSITEARLDESVRRVLLAKQKVGLSQGSISVEKNDLLASINNSPAEALRSRLIEAAITVVRDDNTLLPIPITGGERYAILSIGSDRETAFGQRCKDYIPGATVLHTDSEISGLEKETLLRQLSQHDHVVISVHGMSRYNSKNYGLTASMLDLLNALQAIKPYTLVLFGNPYSLKFLDDISTVVVAYEKDDLAQDLTAQAIFGANDIRGTLPVSASVRAVYGQGKIVAQNGTLGYAIPERVGLNSGQLDKIDSIMQYMQTQQAAPGGQVLVAKDGKIVWYKSYGYHTYKKESKVGDKDIYDVASVTKVAATTVSLMKLYDEGRLSLTAPLRQYLPETDTCDKKHIVIESMLAHHARLPGWIPFYKKTISEGKYPRPLPTYYATSLQSQFTIPVADDLFMRTDYIDTIWSRIYGCELRDQSGYKYSDLGFYLADNLIRRIDGRTVADYANQEIYSTLGLESTGYRPLRWYDRDHIVPSERDKYFRQQTIDGHVHDMGAAMLGGVSGHAGLFSNAKDLAVIMQMVLNGGHYGGHEIFGKATVQRFTQRYHASTRRGIGWDMKELNPNKQKNMCSEASADTYGHLGFTGTAVFVDPQYDLVYVFLSNRTYPTMKGNKLGRLNIRPKVQAAIYNAIIDPQMPRV